MKAAVKGTLVQLFLQAYVISSEYSCYDNISRIISRTVQDSMQGSELHVFYSNDPTNKEKKLDVSTGVSISQASIKVLMQATKWKFVVYDETKTIVPEQQQIKSPKIANIVFFLDNHAALGALTNVLKQSRILNYNTVVLVVIRTTVEDDVLRVLQLLWDKLRIVNATVVAVDNSTIQFYTWFPYAQSKQLVVIDGASKNMFPHKIPINFQGYPIIAAIDYMEPYVMPPERVEHYGKGVEVYIMDKIGEYFNMTIIYRTSPRGVNSRVVYVKGQTSGLFGLLNERKADVAFAGMMRNPDRFATSESLYSHTEDQLKWSFPKPEKIVSWASLYRAFSREIWLILAVIIIINSAFLTFLGKFCQDNNFTAFSENLLSIWAVTLDLGLINSPNSTVFRIFTCILFFYVMIISCSYKSCLTTFLTRPSYEPPIESITQALEQGFDIRLHSSSKQSQRDDDNIWQKILLPGRHFYSQDNTENLHHVAIQRTSLYLAIYYTTQFLQSEIFLDDSGKPLIHYFNDRFNTFSTSFFMCPGHPLEELFNQKIMQLVESGIIAHELQNILIRVRRKTMSDRYRASQTGNTRIILKGPKPLTVSELGVIFICTCFSLFTCLISFLLELLAWKYFSIAQKL